MVSRPCAECYHTSLLNLYAINSVFSAAADAPVFPNVSLYPVARYMPVIGLADAIYCVQPEGAISHLEKAKLQDPSLANAYLVFAY